MIWVVISILLVGYLIVRAINKSSPVEQKLLPVPDRIKLLNELIESHQEFLSKSYEQELAEFKKLKHTKHPWKMWDEYTENMLARELKDFYGRIALNTKLCIRLANSPDELLAQLADWGNVLELYRAFWFEKDLNMALIEAGAETNDNELARVERTAKFQELIMRINDRTKAAGLKVPAAAK